MKKEYSIKEKNTLCIFKNKRTKTAFEKLSTKEERARFILRHGKDKCYGTKMLDIETMKIAHSPKIGNLIFCLWKFNTAKEAKEKAIEIYNGIKSIDNENKTEFAIGEEVQMGLVTLVCEGQLEDRICEGCYGKYFNAIMCEELLGNCSSKGRTDKKDVIFKLKEG